MKRGHGATLFVSVQSHRNMYHSGSASLCRATSCCSTSTHLYKAHLGGLLLVWENGSHRFTKVYECVCFVYRLSRPSWTRAGLTTSTLLLVLLWGWSNNLPLMDDRCRSLLMTSFWRIVSCVLNGTNESLF
mgnify:FL=1